MASVAQAVLEFDEAVQAPWRPPLGDGVRARPGRALRVVEPVRSSEANHVHRPRSGGPRPRSRTSAPCYRDRDDAGTATVRAARSPRPRAQRPSGARRPPLRLTRRARHVLAVLGVGAGVALGSWVGAAVAGQDAGLRLAGETSVVVRAGDTLWSLASSVAGDADVREVVDRIQLINGLEGSALQPGQVLRLP